MFPVLAIDFEASCLPRHGKSFPIEVGLSDITGRTTRLAHSATSVLGRLGLDGRSRKPASAFQRDDLWRDGLPVDVVLGELTEAVRGHVVVADSSLDSYWLEALSSAVGAPAPCAIRHVSEWVRCPGPLPG